MLRKVLSNVDWFTGWTGRGLVYKISRIIVLVFFYSCLHTYGVPLWKSIICLSVYTSLTYCDGIRSVEDEFDI